MRDSVQNTLGAQEAPGTAWIVSVPRRVSMEGLWVPGEIRHYAMVVLFWFAPSSFALISYPWFCHGRIALSGSALLQGRSTPLHISDELQIKY